MVLGDTLGLVPTQRAAVGSLSLGNRGAQILRALLSAPLGVRSALVNGRREGAVDQETKQLRPAVVAARVHHQLASVDQREIEVGDDHALTRPEGFAQQRTVGCRNTIV